MELHTHRMTPIAVSLYMILRDYRKWRRLKVQSSYLHMFSFHIPLMCLIVQVIRWIPDYPFTLLVQECVGILQSRTSYLDQLMFVNHEILSAIDGILANSKTPPIIIFRPTMARVSSLMPLPSKKAACMSVIAILNAYYLPGIDPDSIPMDLSPVNSFRFIFNKYFQTALKILPNRQYFSASAHFYQFMDVTDQTQGMCKMNSEKLPET